MYVQNRSNRNKMDNIFIWIQYQRTFKDFCCDLDYCNPGHVSLTSYLELRIEFFKDPVITLMKTKRIFGSTPSKTCKGPFCYYSCIMLLIMLVELVSWIIHDYRFWTQNGPQIPSKRVAPSVSILANVTDPEHVLQSIPELYRRRVDTSTSKPTLSCGPHRNTALHNRKASQNGMKVPRIIQHSIESAFHRKLALMSILQSSLDV